MIRSINNLNNRPVTREFTSPVYCPICTHTVQATVEVSGRTVKVKAGQKCGRCSASLDAGYVITTPRAA
ncbi:MAG: hypothetical protein IT160_00085 [Bryobacterales bacterium]|nr:hypothetical protein [Bryobacterales bacterium]